MGDQRRRDDGLRRTNTVTGWIAAGALALVAVFSAAVAHALPGKGARGVSPASPAPTTAASTSSSAAGLQAPSQPPSQPSHQSSHARAHVVSGAS